MWRFVIVSFCAPGKLCFVTVPFPGYVHLHFCCFEQYTNNKTNKNLTSDFELLTSYI